MRASRGGVDPRERQVLDALVLGIGIRGVADEMVISVETVRTHVKHLHAKTETHSLDQLLAWAFAHNVA